jgi:hypothetical protein
MKRTILILSIGAYVAFAPGARAQGLLSLGSDDDFYSGLPFTTTFGVDSGYDSNPATTSKGGNGSAFSRGTAELAYGSGSRITPVRFGLSVSGIYYYDDVPGLDEDFYYDTRFTLNAKHDLSNRLTIGNNFYLSYEVEPDYTIGASSQRRLDQYLYGYNNLWASYAWSRRVSTITRYTISGIKYDDSAVGEFEDRFTQTLGEELRYAWNRKTTIVAEYRFTSTDYDSAPRDYISHYILAGFDHQISRTLMTHVRAGAELRDDDLYGQQSRPYAEIALRQSISDATSIHWVNRFGLEDSDLGTFDSRYSFRSNLTAEHGFSNRLRGTAGVSFVHNDYSDSKVSPDISEDLVSAQVGLAYRMFDSVDLNTSYNYTTDMSDDELRQYDRHLVSLGLSTTF